MATEGGPPTSQPTMVLANGVELCVRTFGDLAATSRTRRSTRSRWERAPRKRAFAAARSGRRSIARKTSPQAPKMARMPVRVAGFNKLASVSA